MFNEENYWFNQNLFGYKDKTEGTDAYLSIAATASSKDLIVLGQPFLSFRISNHLRKSCMLKIQDVIDLNVAFQSSLTEESTSLFSNSNDNPIIRRYQKNQDFVFEFKTNNNDQFVVKITIRNSSTDFSTIIIPANMIKVLIHLFSNFRDNYAQYISMIEQKMIVYKLEKLTHIENSIKGLYGSLESRDNIQDSGAPEQNSWAGEVTTDMDKFIGENMTNIEVPSEVKMAEEKSAKAPQHEVKSDLFEHIKYDLREFEIGLSNRANIVEFVDELKKNLGFELLPGISDDDMKSITYITTLFYHLILNGHTIHGHPIPSSFPIVKYKPEGHDEKNIELTLDLLLIQGIFRFVRRRLENHVTDTRSNYAVFNMCLRMFTDSLVYGFLDKKDEEKTVSSVISRFNYFKEKGSFKYYEQLLSTHGCPEIAGSDIAMFVREVFSEGLDKAYVREFHESSIKTNGLRLSTNNLLNLEQIINEVIPTEIKEKLGNPVGLESLSPEVQEIFKTKLPKKDNSKSTKKSPDPEKPTMNTIQMFVNKFRAKISPDMFSELFSHLGNFKDKSIDLKSFPFSIDDIDEDVLKALYFWDPESHKNFTQLKRVLDDPMTKELIIAKVKADIVIQNDQSEEWGDVVTNIM